MDSMSHHQLTYTQYSDESQLQSMVSLVQNDLSEPYSVYTYRYFLLNYPELSFLVFDKETCIGVIISKLDEHRGRIRGYIGIQLDK